MYADVQPEQDRRTAETPFEWRRRLFLLPATALVMTSLTVVAATSHSHDQYVERINNSLQLCHAHSLAWQSASISDPLSLTEVLFPGKCLASASEILSCQCHSETPPALESRLFHGLGVFSPAVEQVSAQADRSIPSRPLTSAQLDSTASTLNAALESPTPRIPAPWVFEANDSDGVKTWLSNAHVLEINPRWLDFAMFDSMDLNMTDKPPGAGQSEPQEWRSAFTVGVATDWQFTRNLALHAGYRFYSNPIPNNTTSGAFPNADQHVVACGMRFSEGRHSVSLIYGLDVMDPSGNSDISSARHGDNIDSLTHLVTLNYGFSF